MGSILRLARRLLVAVVAVGGFVALMTWPSLSRLIDANLANLRFDKRFRGWQEPRSLAPLQREELTRALIAALKDSDPGIRERAGYALGRLGPSAEAATPALVDLFEAGSPREQAGAAAGLEGIAALDAPGAVQANHLPEALRWRARKALLAIGTQEARGAAARYLESCPETLRRPIDWCR